MKNKPADVVLSLWDTLEPLLYIDMRTSASVSLLAQRNQKIKSNPASIVLHTYKND